MYFMAVFGSLLRPTYRRDSDIDVLVVTSTPVAAKISIAAVSARLGKRISVQVYRPDQFSVALSQGDPFVREILERPHAILAGSLEHFGANA